MTTNIAPPPAKRRWKLRALIVVSLLLAAGILAAVRWAGSVEREMAAIAAELDVSDPGWRLADIEAARKPIAEAVNAALKIFAIVDKAPRKTFTWDQGYPKPFPREIQLNATQLNSLEADLLPNAEAITEVLAWESLAKGQFPFPVDKEGAIDQKYLLSLFAFSQTLAMHSIATAQHGKLAEAANACRMILELSHLLRDEPFLMGALVRSAIQLNAAKSIQRLFSQGELSEDSLCRLQDALARGVVDANLFSAMRSERAFWYMHVEGMVSGKKPLDEALKGMKWSAWDKFLLDYFPTRLLRHYPELFRGKNELVEITRLPMHAIIDRADQLRWKQSKQPAFVQQQGVSYLLGNVIRLAEPTAAVRCAVAAVACERYRLRHRRWPASLEELVSEKLLDAVPTDPYDGEPLRLKRLAEDVFVYSVGPDRIDNGGVDDYATPGIAGTDAGFRLSNVPSRRQPAFPAPPNVAPPKS